MHLANIQYIQLHYAILILAIYLLIIKYTISSQKTIINKKPFHKAERFIY